MRGSRNAKAGFGAIGPVILAVGLILSATAGVAVSAPSTPCRGSCELMDCFCDIDETSTTFLECLSICPNAECRLPFDGCNCTKAGVDCGYTLPSPPWPPETHYVDPASCDNGTGLECDC